MVKINFNAKNKIAGPYVAVLNVGSLQIPLSAMVMPSSADLRLQLNGVDITNLNLGTLQRTQSQQKILNVKNYSSVSSPAVTVSIDNSNFSLPSNTCVNRVLPPGGTCSLKLSFSATGKTAGGYQANLSVNSNLVAVQAVVQNPVLGEAGGVVIDASVNNVAKSDPLWVLGSLPANSGVSQIVSFKNSGTSVSTPLSVSISGDDEEDFLLVSNTCQDRTLAPGASCSFRLGFSAIDKEPRYHEAQLQFSDKTYNLAAEALPSNECPADSHLEGPVCVRDPRVCPITNGSGLQVYVGMAYGACEIQSCDSAHHVESNSCLSDVRACSIANGQGQEVWNGTGYNACIVKGCDSNFHTEGNACVNNIQSCVVAHGSGTKLWNGASYNACIANACDSGYHPAGATCDLDVISCSAPNATAATRTWNGSSYGICTIVSCEANFHNESNVCMNDIQSCTVSHGSGTKLWNGSSYNACVVNACDSGFDLIANACYASCLGSEHHNPSTQVCEANVISCSMANAASATQTWNGSAYGSCMIQSCNSGYHNTNNVCELDVIACAPPSNATAASQTWNGSAYGSCMATACVANYMVSGGSCVEICPSGEQLFYYTGSNQTFTSPVGCTKLIVEVYGGGGGGSAHVVNHGSWGGGGGGFAKSQLTTSGGTQYQVIVGAGGPGAFDGSSGGSSSFGGLLTGGGGNFISPGSGSGGNISNYTGGSGNRWADFSWGGGGGGGAGGHYTYGGYSGAPGIVSVKYSRQ